jgi:hypothetical protein
MLADPVERFLREVDVELENAWEKYHAVGLQYVPRQVWDMRCDALEMVRRVVEQVCDDRGV